MGTPAALMDRYAEDTLGAILVKMKLVCDDDVAEACRKQQNGSAGKKLGEILVEQGKLSAENLERALNIQGMFRDGDPSAALMEILDSHVSRYRRSVTRVGAQVAAVRLKLG